MTSVLRPGLSRCAFALLVASLPVFLATGLVAQNGTKRPVTHDDYDRFPSIRNTSYSRNGEWMAFSVEPSVGDGVLYIREVDGDKAYQFDRGGRVTFSQDNKLAFFKIGKSDVEERRKKLEKLHEKKKEEAGEVAEEEEGLPPDIIKALEERGMTQAQALQMIEERGVSLSEVRGFLGLAEPKEKKAPPAKAGGKDEDDKAAKALAKRLHVLDLATGEVTKIEQVKGFDQPEDSTLLILHLEKPEPEKKKEEKSEGGEKKPETEKSEKSEKSEESEKKKEPKDPLEKKRKDGTKLVLRDLATGADTVLEHVLAYGTVADDGWLWYTVGTAKATEGVVHGLFARELKTGRTVELLGGYSNVSGVRTDRDETKLAFSSDARTFGKDKDEVERDLYLWDFSGGPARRVVTSSSDGVPAGYRIQSSGLGFSRDGSVLTFGVKRPKAEELPKILPEDEIKLDIWHWQDGQLQPVQAKRSDPADATLTAVYHDDVRRVVVLGNSNSPRVSLITPDGSHGLQSDDKPYELAEQWDGNYRDYYLVNTVDGGRRKIITGLRGSASASPNGRFVIWFDHRDYDWHAFDTETSKVTNLTAAIGVAFDREDDDRPEPHGSHGSTGWTESDQEVLLNDEFDIWAVNPATGAFRCVTDGLGRAASIRFRNSTVDLRPDAERDDDEDRTWLRDTLVLKAVDQDTYAEGYYTDSISGLAKPRKIFLEDRGVGMVSRPEDADRLFVTFNKFDEFPDIWTTDLAFGKERKLTDACPMLGELRWGSAELVRWRSGDGVELKGYLVKPDGFDPKRKYPMMVYFYERSSSGIHRFVRPSPGTSPNAAYYVSNGYLWFVPDIVYRDGYPGESCEKCVVSGVQHIIAQGFVDKDGIGAAGHSWGGYQTAHLITRTDIFAAAESGAPVVDMFSAYGGIRWGSGKSRQFQYEQTQSRIGGTIWEHPMRYWENSPLFHLDKVNTPVIILHNDKDGAVPWYQGIEFIVAMRRLGKEAYMMNYNDEGHGLGKKQNQRDWTRRMQQFFDHHLKGAPAPRWMARGVPYHERMAEKIPDAPSYREALEAGLLHSEELSDPTAAEASGSKSAGAGQGER